MLFLGVDPGLSGAVVIIDGSNVEFFDTPVLEMKVNNKIKNQMDAAACSLLLSGLTSAHRGDCLVSIEKVAPMPSFKVQRTGEEPKQQSMGATSAFNFGVGFGIWQGICAALLLPYQLVHPATWKRLLLKDMEKGKDASRVKALQLYPNTASKLTRKKDHGRADALLLAHYGKVTYNSDNFKPFDLPKEEPQLEIF
jgi:hypothetical protein